MNHERAIGVSGDLMLVLYFFFLSCQSVVSLRVTSFADFGYWMHDVIISYRKGVSS